MTNFSAEDRWPFADCDCLLNRQAEQRAIVVAEAKDWLMTPYHHRAKLKGVGVDCAQLVLGVFECAGLVPKMDTGEYPRDWHMHREAERYIAIISTLAGEITEEQAAPGDVVLFRFGRTFSHGAIITDYPQAIHANLRDGAVVMTDLDTNSELNRRPKRWFSYWAAPGLGAANVG